MEHPAFDGRAYAIAAGSRRLLEDAGVWDRLAEPACPILDIRVSDGRLGRPASPLFLHFDHRERRRGGIRPHGRGAQPADGAERAHARAAGAARVRAGHRRGGAARRRAPPCASPEARASTAASWWRRRAATRRCAGRPASRSPICRTTRPASSARSATSIRTTTPRSSISCRPARSRNCRCAPAPTRWKAARPTSPPSSGPSAPPIARRMLALDDARFADAIARRLGGHLGAVRVVGPPLELSARRAARASLLRHASRAGGRCGAHHPSDRRPGAQPRLPRCDGAGRPADRGVARAARTRAHPTCCGATSGGGGRTIC